MDFKTRKLIKPEDLNPRGTLYGGRVLDWIDEECSIFTMVLLKTNNIVTKFISEIDFVSSAKLGEVVEIGVETIGFGNSSITLKCIVRNLVTKRNLVNIEKIVFVSVDENGKPTSHNMKGKK